MNLKKAFSSVTSIRKKMMGQEILSELDQSTHDIDHDKILKLIKDGASLKEVNNQGRTALVFAAALGSKTLVETMLKHGAKVHHQTHDGNTALIHAAIKGHTRVIEKIIEHGGNVNHVNNFGNTALLRAVVYNRFNTVQFLVQNGADLDILNHNNKSVLEIAQKRHHADIEEYLQVEITKKRKIARLENHKKIAKVVEKGAGSQVRRPTKARFKKI